MILLSIVQALILALAIPLLAIAVPFGNASDSIGDAMSKRAVVGVDQLAKRADDRMTFYDTSVGLGACGEYHGNDEFTVAVNSAQFHLNPDGSASSRSYPGPLCGMTITISYGGKTANARIEDECPGCPNGGLDLSIGLFQYLAPLDVGVIYGTWWYSNGGPPPPPATPTPTPEPSTPPPPPASTTLTSTERPPAQSLSSSASSWATSSTVATSLAPAPTFGIASTGPEFLASLDQAIIGLGLVVAGRTA